METTYVENVAEGPDAERVIRQLASSGNQLIFTTSFGFMNPTVRVARQFPQVKFEHATGYQTAPNVAVYNARFYEGRAVCGAIAGHISKSGIVGYIGSFPIPEVVMGINAFTVAMQKVQPRCPGQGRLGQLLVRPGQGGRCRQGADRPGRRHHLPAHRQPGAAAGRRRSAACTASARPPTCRPMRRRRSSPRSSTIWSDYYIERVQAVIDGTWETQIIWWGLKEGMVEMAPYGPAVTAEAAAAGDAVREGIIAGTLHPFDGPIENQAGEVVVAEGESLSDEQMLKMDWWVKGVQA